MFGRDRNSYVGMDVLSDDEDMEADATILEKEEKMRFILALTIYTVIAEVLSALVPALRRRRTSWHSKKSDAVKRKNVGARRRRMRERGATNSNTLPPRLLDTTARHNIISGMLAAIVSHSDLHFLSASAHYTDGTHSPHKQTCH